MPSLWGYLFKPVLLLFLLFLSLVLIPYCLGVSCGNFFLILQSQF